MLSIERLRKLAGLKEASPEILSQEEIDDQEDAKFDREQKIKGLIKMAFEKLGFEIGRVFYDEDEEREAIVEFEESEIPLKKLNLLHGSGLVDAGQDFILRELSGKLEVVFHVSSELDQAV